MREFSAFEQGIIKEKLIEGSGLSTMLSDSVYEKARWLVRWPSGDEVVRFEFRSDDLEAQPAYNELIDMIELLQYLEDEKLIRKYHPAATILREFKPRYSISLGKSESEKVKTFIPDGASKYGEFIKKNENYRFCALEPLKAHVTRGFKSIEEQRHEANTALTRRGQNNTVKVALGTMVLTAIISAISLTVTTTNSKRSNNKIFSEFERMRERRREDSINVRNFQNENLEISKELKSIKKTLDSIRTLRPSKKKTVKNPSNHSK